MESNPSEDDAGSLAAARFPLLVYDYDEPPPDGSPAQTMLSVGGDGSSRTYRVPELISYMSLETPCGLVLLVDPGSFQCSLWNPRTGGKTALPAMDEMPPEPCRCLLSDAVSSPDCILLVYHFRAFRQPELLFCQVGGGGSGKWIRQSYDLGFYNLPESYSPPKRMHISTMAAVHGKFYFNDPRDDGMGVLSFAHGPEPHLELSTFGAAMPRFVSDALHHVTVSYLLECSQELYVVCLFYLVCTFERLEEVGAYRMDFSKQEWCKVTDIGDNAFLLGPSNFAASCPAMEYGLKKGCVYFANDFMGHSNDFHVFDLAQGTRELVQPTLDIPVLLRRPFWMVPVVT